MSARSVAGGGRPARTVEGPGRWRRAVVVLMALVAAAPATARAQDEAGPRRIFGVEATPVGALPPLALPMPASRNHNYVGIRAQTGIRRSRHGAELTSIAGGLDLQWRGGSIIGITGGYQSADCQPGDELCQGHAFFGARARFNIITGGPTIAKIFDDYSATSTLGAEIGFGTAPDAAPDFSPCTLDVGLPFSVAMLQTVRVVAFFMPSGSMDINCGSGNDRHKDFILNLGVGVQQLGLRGLDAYLGFQRVVRDQTGYQFGLSITYVHLP